MDVVEPAQAADATRRARVRIASGSDRYADPWHPFARTSALLAEILDDAGFIVEIVDDVEAAMTLLGGVDLLVVNAGDPWRADDGGVPAPDDSVSGLAEALDRGIGILAMHSAVSSLRDYPEWAAAIGAIWVPGLSFHPPSDLAAIRGVAALDGIEIESFHVFDERYCRLQIIGSSRVVAEHGAQGVTYPTAWVREHGAARIAVDVLGHDERSYDSAGHRALIVALARWSARRSD